MPYQCIFIHFLLLIYLNNLLFYLHLYYMMGLKEKQRQIFESCRDNEK